jgi:hypothetical protein
MTYDAARGQIVLFGGHNNHRGYLRDTWTWDGTDWTQHLPAHSPSKRWGVGMAYDSTQARVVLFGGYFSGHLGDTWTWDGTDWTHQSPAHSPSPRNSMGMAYDSALEQVVVFGGNGDAVRGDTWTWDGIDWTQQSPTHSPIPRYDTTMAYDEAREQVVLFGGFGGGALGDTWVWNGTDWTQRLGGSLARLLLPSGPPGAFVLVTGWGYAANERIRLTFIGPHQGRVLLANVTADASGAFQTRVTVPSDATVGKHRVKARGLTSEQVAKRLFTVTSP